MEKENQETSPSAQASATEATPTGRSATLADPADSSEEFAELATRICSRPPPEEPSHEELQRGEQLRRRLAHKDLIRPMGTLYEDCTAANYQAASEKQRKLVTALRAYADDMPAEVAAGNGIVLFGSTGTGKDHLLAALSRVAILKHGLTVEWRNGMDLYGEMRDRIRNDKAEKDLVAALVKPDILYLSDPLPPSGDLSQYQASMLQRIFDGRIRNRKPVWVSMNVQGSDEADRRMGPALVDRLRPGAVCCHCDWKSHRQPRMV